MMQRRIVSSQQSPSRTGASKIRNGKGSNINIKTPLFPRSGGSTNLSSWRATDSLFCNAWFLLACAALITIATYTIPMASDIEKKMVHEVYQAEQRLENNIGQAFQQNAQQPQQVPPISHAQHEQQHDSGVSVHDGDAARAQSAQRTAAMEQQDLHPLAFSTKWVDGEKKLKQKLLVLAQRQAEGKDLGVPVLTRYLGEDIPAWISGTEEEVAEWKAKVAARYAEMDVEEQQWKIQMKHLIESQYQNTG
jgi:hypothetical protein